MSDEPKCRVCGKYNGPKDSADWCRCPQVLDMDVSEDTVTPPTPDPRERGEEEYVPPPASDEAQLIASISRPTDMVSLTRAAFDSLTDEVVALRAKVAAHPAPARGVTVTKAMVEEMAKQAALGHTRFCVGVHENGEAEWIEWPEAFTRLLTPDAEGGA